MHSPKISLIAAISENRVLAKNGKIPWKIPLDYHRYRELIKDHVIIAGRKTFDASYTDTINIVVTRDQTYMPPARAVVVHSVTDALAKARSTEFLDQADYQDELFVIGGGEIFHETIAIADRLYLTIIHQKIAGDTFFPDFRAFTTVIEEKDERENGYAFTFLTLERNI